MSDIKQLNGLQIKEVIGLELYSDKVTFKTDGGNFVMYHSQDCCESVSISDLCGDVMDLIDAKVLSASEDGRDATEDEASESGTWTFYNIQTDKGHVQIRWLGVSNGYYSESVYFEREEDI